MKTFKFLLIGIILLANTLNAQKKVTTHWGFSNIVKEIYFVDAQGVLNGNYKLWSREGVLYSNNNYLKGEKNGLCIDYSGKRDGTDDFLGTVTLCNGKPMEETMYKNGKKIWHNYYTCIDGKQILVNKEVAISAEASRFTSYFSNGRVNEQYNKLTEYYSKASGDYKKYFESGKIEISGNYKKSNKQGHWFELSADGDTVYSANYDNDVELSYIKFNGKRHLSEKKMDTSFNFNTVLILDSNGRIEQKKLYKIYPESRMNISQGIHKSRWGYYLAELINYHTDASNDTTNFYLVPKINFGTNHRINYNKDSYGDTIYQALNEKEYYNYKKQLDIEDKMIAIEKAINNKKEDLNTIYFPELMKASKPNLYETYKLLNNNYYYNKMQDLKYTIRYFNGEDQMSVYVSNTFPNKSELDSILNDNDAITKTVLSLKNQQLSLLDQQINVCNKIMKLCTVADTKDIEKSLRKINYDRFDAIKAFAVLGVDN